jgi:hypothetical protein
LTYFISIISRGKNIIRIAEMNMSDTENAKLVINKKCSILTKKLNYLYGAEHYKRTPVVQPFKNFPEIH